MFCVFVHLIGANLNFNRFATRANNRCVQRLIEVELRHRNVVFEAPRNWIPSSVQSPQNRIAVADGFDQDAHRDKVKDLIKCLIADDHLLINRIVILRSPGHRSLCT